VDKGQEAMDVSVLGCGIQGVVWASRHAFMQIQAHTCHVGACIRVHAGVCAGVHFQCGSLHCICTYTTG